MIAASGRLFIAVVLFALLLWPALSAPPTYELLIAAPNAAPADRVAGLLERNLPEVALSGILPAERYRKYARFPVAACSGREYYLLAHGKRLIAFGCIDDASATTELQKIRRALARDRDTVRESTTEALYDGALNSAAAGELPESRRYAGLARRRPQADTRLVDRLQRVLDRAR